MSRNKKRSVFDFLDDDNSDTEHSKKDSPALITKIKTVKKKACVFDESDDESEVCEERIEATRDNSARINRNNEIT